MKTERISICLPVMNLMEAENIKKIVVALVAVLSVSALGYGLHSMFTDSKDEDKMGDDEPVGGVLPDLYFMDHRGERKEIHEYKGRFLVIHLTGLNSTYCKYQIENLTVIREMYPRSVVEIISIEVWNEGEDWEETLDRMAELKSLGTIDWLYGVDAYGDFAYSYMDSVPRIVVMNPHARVIYEPSPNPIPWEWIQEAIDS
ncbi:MAG TPA: hypothetical protein ENN76_01090 [Euryarchaeota archaeon]|nr:hypothetical protein [Euryarchaeota archaeon]